MKTIIYTILLILFSAPAFATDSLVYNCPNNPTNVCVDAFAPEYLTNGGTIEEIKAQLEGHGLTVTRVPQSDIPTDRTFRGAWAIDSGKIGVDMPRARIIHKARMEVIKQREQKVLRQEIIDKELFGENASAQRANHAALDNAITNVDTAINNAQNPTALKNIWPGALPTD